MHSPWRLDQRRASLELGPLTAQIDLDQPALGLHHLKLACRAIESAQLLGVELPPSASHVSNAAGDRFVEAYLRGDDLIATYAEVAQPAFRWQIYWRALRERFPQALVAVEAIVSVQTGLLDSWPQLTLQSMLPAGAASLWQASGAGDALRSERFDSGPALKTISSAVGWGCFGFDLPGAAGSYVEMVHPADFDSSSAEGLAAGSRAAGSAAAVSLRHPLFRERLEKGVILRSRVLALLLSERPTSGTIGDIQRAFVDEELPLTT